MRNKAKREVGGSGWRREYEWGRPGQQQGWGPCLQHTYTLLDTPSRGNPAASIVVRAPVGLPKGVWRSQSTTLRDDGKDDGTPRF